MNKMLVTPSFFRKNILWILCLFIGVSGCGFHLRGHYTIPAIYQILKIEPEQPYDRLQNSFRRTLNQIGITIVESDALPEEFAILHMLEQNFSERTTAFGPDVQVNRVVLQLGMSYEITDRSGKILLPRNCIQVERELTVNPNTIYGTDYEREHLKEELMKQAAMQIARQLSLVQPIQCYAPIR